MQNIKLTLSYEGTHYKGWQKTPMGLSIEEELEKALACILRRPVKLQAASRTDAGVHAKGQVVNFFMGLAIELKKLMKRLNGLLPKEIRVQTIEMMPPSFHPTVDARGKEYDYFVCLGAVQLPFHRHFSWHFKRDIDLEAMHKAASFLIGKHDFSAFTNERQNDNIREIFGIEILPLPGRRLKIRVSGNHFLYKMVRNIVGTLLYVGCGKIAWEEVETILASKDRTKAGVTAPCHGLFLNRVFYD